MSRDEAHRLCRAYVNPGPRLLFQAVYRFESRFLACSREELGRIGEAAGLHLVEWRSLPTPFFAAEFAALT